MQHQVGKADRGVADQPFDVRGAPTREQH
jgi:hypothetical protein